jgi:hypothetical protein
VVDDSSSGPERSGARSRETRNRVPKHVPNSANMTRDKSN